jgi:PilZ domain
MNGVERRTVKRLIMRVPMRVRGMSEPAQNERGVESLNISIRGTYFVSEEKFQVGEKIEVRLKMPGVVVSGQKTEWRFTGRVTHVDKLGPYGKSGVGVSFLSSSAENGLTENLSLE